MRDIRRIFSVGAAALVLGAGLVAGTSGAAQAAPGDCVNGAKGFTDIPDSLSGRGVGGAGALILDKPVSVASYAMQTGSVGGRSMGWGVLTTNPTTWGAGARADVWMDVTNDSNKRDWIQCGPFSLTTAGKRITTPAYPTSNSASRAFRVCASVNGPSGSTGVSCTSWW
jgi:hypothetical protein